MASEAEDITLAALRSPTTLITIVNPDMTPRASQAAHLHVLQRVQQGHDGAETREARRPVGRRRRLPHRDIPQQDRRLRWKVQKMPVGTAPPSMTSVRYVTVSSGGSTDSMGTR